MLRMELSQLRAFVTASRYGSITSAARALHLTASPVSRSVRGLEDQLGERLFERQYHHLVLTAAGASLLPHAVEVLQQVDRLPDVVRAERHPLRIGFSPWLPRGSLERLSEVVSDSGEPAPDLVEDVSSAVINMVRHGELDLALVSLPVLLPQVESRLFESFGCRVFFASPDVELGSVIPASTLAGRRVLILHTEFQPAAMGRIVEGLQAAGVRDIAEVGPEEVMAIESRLRRTGEVLLGPSPLDTPIPELLANNTLTNAEIPHSELGFDVGLVWRSNHTAAVPRIHGVLQHIPGEGWVV